MESCCWGQGVGALCGYQHFRAGAKGPVSLPEAEWVLKFPSQGAQAASAPSMGLAALDTAVSQGQQGNCGGFP